MFFVMNERTFYKFVTYSMPSVLDQHKHGCTEDYFFLIIKSNTRQILLSGQIWIYSRIIIL